MTSVDRLRKAGWSETIVGFAEALDADGYEITLERHDDGRIVGEIAARPDACEDCLVPKPVMASILGNACGVMPDAIELRYPTG